MNKKLALYILFLISVICAPTALADKVISPENERALQQLDDLLQRADEFAKAREMQIEQLKKRLYNATNDEEKFWITKDIFDEYKIFDGDSALLYGKMAIKVADGINRPDLQNELHIVSSYTYAGIGLLDESYEELSKVNIDELSANAKVDYMGQQIYLLTHVEQFKNVNPVVEQMPKDGQAILDSIVNIIEPTHPEYYYYIGYQALKDKESAQKALDTIIPQLDNLEYNSQQDAKLLWVVARLYSTVRNRERKLHYLTLSAITDMKIGNREIASLEEISGMMDSEGDLNRAYNYIQYCLQCAEKYKNRVRALRIATLESYISKKYQERFMEMQQRIYVYLIITILLAVILLVSTIYIYRQRQKLAKSNKQINSAKEEVTEKLSELSKAYSQLAENNQKLIEMSDELRLTNDKIAESDYVKVKCIGSIIALCSQYINKMEDSRKGFARQLKTNRYEQAMQMAESPEQSQKELKEFFEQFDSMFLSIYPDFVADFNALLRPEDAIVPKNPSGLNTELRIHALIRLGILDSVSIAEILHCSVQTVYNKRMKVRNKAIVSKDNFVEIVKNLGKSSRNTD